jgi:hypothetical protein
MLIGIGAVHPRTFIAWMIPSVGVEGFVSNVFIANLPQLILSFIYYSFNGIFTSFLLGNEWNMFASQRKGLRVSNGAQGSQRTTYFLQLPFRWAIPLLTLSAILHWLCSQSLFLVSLQIRYSGSSRNPDSVTQETQYTCGYSPTAILVTISVALVMGLFGIGIGRKRFRNRSMPVAGSCSLAISAACHLAAGEDQLKAPLLPLKWGVTGFKKDDSTGEIVGHCAFSSKEVESPQPGQVFAG